MWCAWQKLVAMSSTGPRCWRLELPGPGPRHPRATWDPQSGHPTSPETTGPAGSASKKAWMSRGDPGERCICGSASWSTAYRSLERAHLCLHNSCDDVFSSSIN